MVAYTATQCMHTSDASKLGRALVNSIVPHMLHALLILITPVKLQPHYNKQTAYFSFHMLVLYHSTGCYHYSKQSLSHLENSRYHRKSPQLNQEIDHNLTCYHSEECQAHGIRQQQLELQDIRGTKSYWKLTSCKVCKVSIYTLQVLGNMQWEKLVKDSMKTVHSHALIVLIN